MRFAASFLVVVGVCLLLFTPAATSETAVPSNGERCLYQSPVDTGPIDQTQPVADKSDRSDYDGYLRIYVVEPTSRWSDHSARKYEFGFLDFAFDSLISLPYLETFHTTRTWNSADDGFGAIAEDNIMVIAAVFNSEGHQAYSDPPTGAPYTAHYVDAAAASTPGVPGSNYSDATHSHTIFIEEGSATW